MSRVLTVSRFFPAYHPKAGQPTYFVEKIWKSLYELTSFHGMSEIEARYNEVFPVQYIEEENIHNHLPKGHTIRFGHRWKAGDKFSPRVWSGKPYNSKQVVIAPDIEIVKTWDFEIRIDKDYVLILIDNWPFYEENSNFVTFWEAFETLAKNDGLTLEDFKAWFKYPSNFDGQIICWNPNINY